MEGVRMDEEQTTEIQEDEDGNLEEVDTSMEESGDAADGNEDVAEEE